MVDKKIRLILNSSVPFNVEADEKSEISREKVNP